MEVFLERSYSDLVQACGNKVTRHETIKSILKESIIEIISGKYKRKRGIKDNSQAIALNI